MARVLSVGPPDGIGQFLSDQWCDHGRRRRVWRQWRQQRQRRARRHLLWHRSAEPLNVGGSGGNGGGTALFQRGRLWWRSGTSDGNRYAIGGRPDQRQRHCRCWTRQWWRCWRQYLAERPGSSPATELFQPMAAAGETSLGGGGGGSGGRIAIFPNTNLFAGVISAYGGAGFVPGGAGTIYIKTNNNAFAQVVLDNGGSHGATLRSSPPGVLILPSPMEQSWEQQVR